MKRWTKDEFTKLLERNGKTVSLIGRGFHLLVCLAIVLIGRLLSTDPLFSFAAFFAAVIYLFWGKSYSKLLVGAIFGLFLASSVKQPERPAPKIQH